MIAHLSYVICDVCGASAEVAGDAREARVAAELEGFVSAVTAGDGRRVVRTDYCPEHRALATEVGES